MSIFSFKVGRFAEGPTNLLTDVKGLRVGHCTLDQNAVQTGVTVIVPANATPFENKIPAGLAVINGFGKSVGLVQVEELGQIETTIALTNTFSVSDIAKAQIHQTISQHPECGRSLPTVNPLVFECNDGYLNDLHAFAIQARHYQHAYDAATTDFAQGAVGAGRGMSCFGIKGGIGSASRIAPSSDYSYTIGALVLANFGRTAQLLFKGQAIGAELEQALQPTPSAQQWDKTEKGSIIIILATDAPLDARQLQRLAKRSAAGLARTGSVYGHGSGDIALAFSTAYTLSATAEQQKPLPELVHETQLDPLFEAAAESVEHAILNAIWHAEPVSGRDGHHRVALRDLPLDWTSILR